MAPPEFVTPELAPARLKAGEDYLKALRALHLEPDALLWGYDHTTSQFVLVLVTDFFEFKGPYEISKLLFKAYNAAATPAEIDPFIIRLHSPDQLIFDEMKLLEAKITETKTGKPALSNSGEPVHIIGAHIDGLSLKREWVYKMDLRRRRRSPVVLMKQWNTFKSSVDKLAA
jgi:hypothetical protein